MVGESDGAADGMGEVGCMDGAREGMLVGAKEGDTDGSPDG